MIGIITVFYSENVGSVLQAYAMRRKLDDLGFESVFINTRNKYSAHSLRATILRVGKSLFHLNLRDVKNAFVKYCNFERLLQDFPYKELNIDEFDKIVLGSDTVWDVNSTYFRESSDLFWVNNIPGEKVVSYAVSVANSSVDDISRLPYAKETINKIKCLSVRDRYSYSTIHALTDRMISVVCDPTLLLQAEDYAPFIRKITDKRYIALYLFEQIDEVSIGKIKDYARNNNLKLISIGNNLNWCDHSVPATVDNFLSYYAKADGIVTNTFHGTVFSVIFKRDFMCFAPQKNKVVEFLKGVGLDDRLVTKPEGIDRLLRTKIDYSPIERILKEQRNDSIQYLKSSLNK